MKTLHDFADALAKAGAFVRPLEDHVGYRAARPPWHCPAGVLLNGRGALTSIGRFDGPEPLPTLYLSASPTAVVAETRYAHGHGGRLVVHGSSNPRHEVVPLCIVPVRVRLQRVLRLQEALGVLPITMEEVTDPSHARKAASGARVPVHELARAARKNGIQGVLYPSRYEPGSDNLAVFVENAPRGSLRALYGATPCPCPWRRLAFWFARRR
ncbi:RES family NAD+ phosphorylase [Oceanithermus sp.]|uniref:RES family NAD+ phosphorylase n=1 Tax=Oceanithermus sp. TaxID=2268145 RepID=UPI0025EF8B48|nr:RES family NAD+ phosphorylase [Oceanithermus sp.]